MSTPPNSIRPNAGGALSVRQTIGRDEFIEDFWRFLARRSVMILAPRRSGKTSVCKLAEAQQADGFSLFYRDLEGIDRATTFVNQLHRDVSGLLKKHHRLASKARDLYRSITGAVEIQGFKLELAEEDWTQLLDAVFSDLQAWADDETLTLVLVWDEFPLFIRDVARAGKPREAMALLDLLRALRARYPRVRMVFTGSIGLHEVIEELRRDGYGNNPTNDMKTMELDVLTPEHARHLATMLVRGAGGTPTPEIAEAFVEVTEGHPFLIQHVAESLEQGGEFTPDRIREVFEELLNERSDPFELSHYIERLSVVMGTDDERVARNLLDRLATGPESGHTLQDLIDQSDEDPEAVRRVSTLLRRDGYVRRTDKRFTFARRYLQRYWMLERGL